eukprot:5870708-Amphidinium_carterae.1
MAQEVEVDIINDIDTKPIKSMEKQDLSLRQCSAVAFLSANATKQAVRFSPTHPPGRGFWR